MGLLIAFTVPLQLLSSVFAFLGRDSLVGTSFGVFTGTWLAFAVSQLTSPPGTTRPVLGVFFLSIGAIFVMLVGGGIFGGKAAAGLVGLVFVAVAVAVAGYVGFATLLEDSARRPILPMGRRGAAQAAISDGLGAQLADLENEAGVREQL